MDEMTAFRFLKSLCRITNSTCRRAGYKDEKAAGVIARIIRSA
ncbi:MAG TPA: hypothetical protein VGC97_07440 [Pyrinomonadaceae bacterium]|jgi:hypothetical protein